MYTITTIITHREREVGEGREEGWLFCSAVVTLCQLAPLTLRPTILPNAKPTQKEEHIASDYWNV